jgi:hypothetical protein
MTAANYYMRHALALVMVLAAALLGPNSGLAQPDELYEKPPINYSTTKPQDAVTELEAKSASSLQWTGGGRIILQRLLKELRVPIESQVLVFSKTSFQRNAINPSRPRAIYFSDNCYVGWVPDGLIEVATIDPRLGPVFYSFDPNSEQPHFVRDNNCMTCHGGQFVRGIPGVFVRSLSPPKLASHCLATDRGGGFSDLVYESMGRMVRDGQARQVSCIAATRWPTKSMISWSWT